MTVQILFSLYPFCLVGLALLWLLKIRAGSRPRWFFEAVAAGSIAAFAFMGGTWAFTSYYLRYSVPVLFALIALYSCRRANAEAGHVMRSTRRLALSVLVLVLFAILDTLAIASYFPQGELLNFSFPLREGTYCVLQGGSSVVTNPFHSMVGNWMAHDIVGLNAFGNRANGVAPSSLEDYEIFGDLLYSPCAGTVLASRDSLPDNAPGNPDVAYPEGNFVIVRCGDVEFLLGHLMQGSAADAGAAVTPAQSVGKVGNSGNSLEPHLHIGARRGGAEIGVLFDGQWLSQNSLIRTNAPRTPSRVQSK